MKSIFILAFIFTAQAAIATSTTLQPGFIHGNVQLYYNEITNNKEIGRIVCEGTIQLPLQDVRQSTQQNGSPSVAFKDCAIAENGKQVLASAWLGAGILAIPGHTADVEDQRLTELAITVGDQHTSFWLSEYDLTNKDKKVTMDLPVPPQLQKPGSDSQWMRVIAEFNEQ